MFYQMFLLLLMRAPDEGVVPGLPPISQASHRQPENRHHRYTVQSAADQTTGEKGATRTWENSGLWESMSL